MRAGSPSLTARWVAAQRAARSSSRPATATGDVDAEDRLYRGFSRVFVLPGLRPTGMAARTRFFDDECVSAIDSGVDQIALVGAGYDGRALRFRSPGVRWFEVDHPATQQDKRRRVAALDADVEHLTFVPVDLTTDDLGAALERAGHNVERPSLFVCEGLFSYLPDAVARSLCTTLHARAAVGSVLAANFRVVAERGAALTDTLLAIIGERRQADYRPGDPERLLADTGWHVAHHELSDRRRGDGTGRLLLISAVTARGGLPDT